MRNKKSQVEDYLPLLAIIVVLLVVMSLISYFNIKEQKDSRARVSSQIIVKDSGQLLANYLSSPFGNSPETNVAEGISIYYLEKNPEVLNQLNTITDNFFSGSSFETDYSTWSLELNHNEDELIIESQRAKTSQILRKEIATTFVPMHNGDLIEARLFIVTTRFVS